MSSRDRDPAMPPDVASAPGAGSIARPCLAVVEDDAELREKILLPVLGAAGFEVTGLASALQLYRSWATSPFDLVLLDIGLPDDDGVEIAAHLRQLSPSPGIVIYTGRGHSLDRLRGLRAGADAYLVKPLDMAEVVQTLHNVNARRVAQASPQPEGPQHRPAPAPAPRGQQWLAAGPPGLVAAGPFRHPGAAQSGRTPGADGAGGQSRCPGVARGPDRPAHR